MTTTTEMTEAQAWEQVAAWIAAGYRVFWKKDDSIYNLFIITPDSVFPFEVASVDIEPMRVIDCVQRMTRLLAFQAK